MLRFLGFGTDEAKREHEMAAAKCRVPKRTDDSTRKSAYGCVEIAER